MRVPSEDECTQFKGKLNPEMKLCELLVLGHSIHLPLILFACASSGQRYNIGSPVAPNFCDVIDTAMTGDHNYYLLTIFELLSKSTFLNALCFQYVYLYLITRVW